MIEIVFSMSTSMIPKRQSIGWIAVLILLLVLFGVFQPAPQRAVQQSTDPLRQQLDRRDAADNDGHPHPLDTDITAIVSPFFPWGMDVGKAKAVLYSAGLFVRTTTIGVNEGQVPVVIGSLEYKTSIISMDNISIAIYLSTWDGGQSVERVKANLSHTSL